MKRFLVFVVIICVAFLLYAGAQEEDYTDNMNANPNEVGEVDFPKPVPKAVTRLDVTIIDGMNDKLIKLNNCAVQVVGELHICEDSFTYSNIFLEGDRYEITIHVRPKK